MSTLPTPRLRGRDGGGLARWLVLVAGLLLGLVVTSQASLG